MGVIALDLGGTKLAAALFTGRGTLAHKTVAPLDGRGGEEVGELIRRTTRGLCDAARKRRLRITAIGASVPGMSIPGSGRVWAPNIPGWENYPLRRTLSEAVRGKRIPVAIESDRSCCILGESWQGAARGCRDAIGWLALDRPFRPEYSDCGCFEYHASGEGLAKVAAELRRTKAARRGTLSAAGTALTAPEVFRRYRRGDPVARAVIAQAIEFWGMAVANLVSLFNPQKIIFGGGVFGPALELLERILVEARQWAQPVAIRHVKLAASQLGGDAALYGAAFMALRKTKEIQ